MNTLLATLCSNLDLEQEHTALLNARDTSDVWRQFAIWMLVDEEYGVIQFTRPGSDEHRVIKQVADLYIQKCKDIDAWQEAGAKAAYYGSYVYADYAAWHASQAAACAACAAGAPYTVLRASYAAAAAEAAAWSADAAATAAHYERMADKLIELINAAPLITTNK